MKKAEQLFNDLNRFTQNEKVKNLIEATKTLLDAENKYNLEYNIKVRDIRENTVDIGDMSYIEDYEIITGSYGEKCLTLEEKEYLEQKIQDRINQWADKDMHLTDVEYDHYNEKVKVYTEDEWEEKRNRVIEKIQDKISSLEEELSELKYLEREDDEIYWNEVYQYDGIVNTEIAQRLGFGVLRINDTGEEYMFLQGCGMDMSAKFIAYQALEFGYIDYSFVDKFRDVNFLKYVMGKEVFKEVVKVLGIEYCIEDSKEKADKRIKEFDDKINNISKLKDDGADKMMVGTLAMLAFADTLK